MISFPLPSPGLGVGADGSPALFIAGSVAVEDEGTVEERWTFDGEDVVADCGHPGACGRDEMISQKSLLRVSFDTEKSQL